MNSFFILGAIFALLAVIIGAFGAHGLEKIISDDKMLMRFNTGVEYQFYHAFGIFIIAFLLKEQSSLLLTSAGIAFIFGILLFSGSLYSYVLTGNKVFGMITPLGGLAFIIGWLLMLIYFFKPHQ